MALAVATLSLAERISASKVPTVHAQILEAPSTKLRQKKPCSVEKTKTNLFFPSDSTTGIDHRISIITLDTLLRANLLGKHLGRFRILLGSKGQPNLQSKFSITRDALTERNSKKEAVPPRSAKSQLRTIVTGAKGIEWKTIGTRCCNAVGQNTLEYTTFHRAEIAKITKKKTQTTGSDSKWV